MKMKEYKVTYINQNGDKKVKYFDNKSWAMSFIELLDRKIEKGTCGGYIYSH